MTEQKVPDAEAATLPPWWRHFEDRALPDLHFKEQALQDFLDQAAEKYGDRKAVVFQNLTLTYRELRDKAETLAAALRLRGVNEGDRVAIMLPNIPQTVIAFWAVLKAGAVAVMTNPLYMEKELTHHFEDSQAKVLITLDLLWPKIDGLLPKLGLDWCVVTRIADGLAFPLNKLQPWKAKREGHLPDVPFDGKNVVAWRELFKTRERYSAGVPDPKNTLALLQYTGGTTGFSKAAMLTHQNLSAQMQILLAIIGGDADSKRYTFLSIMPFFHVFGLAGNILLPALYAAATIPVPRYTPGDLLQTIQKYRPNFFIGTPSVYISLMQQKDITKYDLTCIEMCISGSAPFPREAMTRFQDITGANITEGFGLTEASPCVTANPIYGLQKTGSIGVALPATEIRIMDLETGSTELGDNQPGELAVRGPQVMRGYWHRPEETACTLRDGWLYTGDIAYRDEEGYYFIVDRKKDMAIVGGYNVYPREIDEVLYEHPKVAEAVAVSVPHRSRGEALKAYIVPKPDASLTVAELVAHCREKLASYKIPKFFEFREELPKTLVGKVLRRVLREEEARKLKEAGVKEDDAPLFDDTPPEKGSGLLEQARDKAEILRKQAEEMMDQARERAEGLRGQAEELVEQAREKAEDLRKKAEEMMDQAKVKAGGIREQAREKAEDFKGQAGEFMDHAREKAGEMSKTLSGTMDKALRGVRGTREGGTAAPENPAVAHEGAQPAPPEPHAPEATVPGMDHVPSAPNNLRGK